MYPNTYFSLIPAFPRKARAFVAMSFDARFETRWSKVLVPGLGALLHDEVPVQPFRIDLSRTSDAILTEILEAIGDSLVIVADITSTAELDGRAVRNANVLYEVGIAHAVRVPEEVVLLRSDQLRLDFDIAGVRVHTYDPDGDPEGAAKFVTETVTASLAALSARRRTLLRVTAERLTPYAAKALFTIMATGNLRHPTFKTVGQAPLAAEQARAIDLLLGLGAIKANFVRLTAATFEAANAGAKIPALDYSVTPLGLALYEYIAAEMGAFEPEFPADVKMYFKPRVTKTQGTSAPGSIEPDR